MYMLKPGISLAPPPPLYTPLPRRVLSRGEAFLLAVGAFLLTVELLCLQPLKALIRRTFPLQAKKLQL